MNEGISEKYCCYCGGALTSKSIGADSHRRLVCTVCGQIHYKNPKVIVASIVSCNKKILLGKRSEEPAKGKWAVPMGFLECGETLQEGACREIAEETGLVIDPAQLRLHALSTIRYTNEVYAGFRVELDAVAPTDICCGDECMRVDFFSSDKVPWNDIAYAEMANFLRVYFEELSTGAYSIHNCTLEISGESGISYPISNQLVSYKACVKQ